MPFYASFQDLQKELSSSCNSTGKRLQFQEAIAQLQKHGRLLQAPPDITVPNPYEMRENDFERFVDSLYFPVPPKLASIERVEEGAMFPFQRDVFVFRHPRLTRPVLHSHDFWEIECVLRGSCILHFEDELHTLSEGAVCLVAPGSRHDVEIRDDSTVCCIMLRRSTFEASFFSLLSRDDALALFFRTNLKYDQDPNYLMFQTQRSTELETCLFCAFVECYRNDVYSNTCCISHVNLLFAELLRSAGDTPQFYRYQAGSDFSQILHAIRHHYQTLTLTKLAEQFHYSKPHLCTLIKQNTGVSFTELVKQIRLSRATEYLLNTELPVFEIAEIVGYHSADHFARVFRGSFGCSPQEYRKTHTKKGERFIPFEILPD